jgi:ABC-type lipoprotein export system ATPase subunit
MMVLDQVSKTYQKEGQPVRALREVTLDIAAGEFLAVLGPSGSGKSTLMNILGLLDRPDEGTYELDGKTVANLTADDLAFLRNKKVGFVFQAFHLLPRATAVENVELPLIYSDRASIKGLAKKALDEVGLSDRAKHFPSELSGGQQQRVAIARALVNDPDILLADEPTGNLDSESGADVMALFQKLNEAGKTVVVITHDTEVAGYAKRKVRIVDGALANGGA